MAIIHRRKKRQMLNAPQFFAFSVLIGVVAIIWLVTFKFHMTHYYQERPDIYWTVPAIYYSTTPCEGILYWKEKLLTAPASGMIHYPLGLGPVRVAKGDTVAMVNGIELKVDSPGYFVAGLDGLEGKLKYGVIWNSEKLSFEKTNLQYFKEGILVNLGSTIGKLIFSLQGTSFIGMLEPTDKVRKQIKNEFLSVKDDESNSYDKAKINVSQEEGHNKVRVYMNLPWFRLKDVKNRAVTIQIDTGKKTGAMFPISCIVKKKGKIGVLLIRSQSATFVPVEGIYIKGEKFIAVKGITAGQPIVLHPESTREGKIKAK